MCFTCLNPLSEVFPQLLRQNQDFTGRLTLLFYLRGLEICCPPKQGHVQGQSVDFPKGIRHSQKVDQSVKSLLWKITHDLSTKTAGFFSMANSSFTQGHSIISEVQGYAPEEMEDLRHRFNQRGSHRLWG